MMRIQMVRSGLLAVSLAAGFVPAAHAQDAKAAEVIGKTRAAIGGAKLEGLTALSLEASMDRNIGARQMSGAVEMFIELPDKYLRSEVSSGMTNMTMNSGFNGDKAIMPGGGNMSMGPGGAMVFRMGAGGPAPDAVKPTPEQLEQLNKTAIRSTRTEISRMMLGWFGAAHPSLHALYTYAGEAESPDGKAHVIDVKDADGFAARLFIDQNNYLPLMVTYQGRQPRVMTSGGPTVAAAGGAAVAHTQTQAQSQTRQLSDEERKKVRDDMEKRVAQDIAQQPTVEFHLFFDDWRQVDGVNFPHKMRRAVAGETTEEWTINKVKINPKIDAKKFAVDAK
ncbi:MAG: hypothetical protein H0W08_28300 [Acidobacteria bacterium]|nr:hypothetical protein [Acidobacteriota bacterium]